MIASVVFLSVFVLGVSFAVVYFSSRINPRTFTLPALPPPTTSYSFEAMPELSPGNLIGAVSFAFRTPTDMYTGLYDGRIVKVDLVTGVVEDVLNTNSDLRLPAHLQCGDHYLEHLCGRPQALSFDNEGYRLIVLDAYKGLLTMNLEENTWDYISREAEGKKYKYLSSMAISPSSGRIYFTESSEKNWRRDSMTELLEAKGHGRLLMYEPSHNHVYVLADKIRLPTGIVVQQERGKDNALIFSETARGRVRRCYLGEIGDKCTRFETFAEKGLPCLPGDLAWAPPADGSLATNPSGFDNGLLVGCALRRTSTWDTISASSHLRQFLGSFKSDWVSSMLYSAPALARLNVKGKVTDVIESDGVQCMFNVMPIRNPDYDVLGDDEASDTAPAEVPEGANVVIGCPHTWQSSPRLARLLPLK